MKHGIYFIITILFFFNITTVFATMYKSVDADGNVSYTQSPPKTGNYEKIKAKKYKPVSPTAASKKSVKAKESFEEGAQARKENDILKNEEAKNKKLLKDNCEIAKKNLHLFTIYKKLQNEQGEYYRVSDTEREQRIKAAKGNIKQYCK